ncbi:MAG: S-layer family protein [Anaerolineae bacterium]|nr:S-layer family protein [Phycisphaerae bacterium]
MRIARKTALSSLLAAVAAVSIPSARVKADAWNGFFSGQFTLGINWGNAVSPGPTDAANFDQVAPVINTSVYLDESRTVLSMKVLRTSGVGNYQFTQTNNSVLTATNNLHIVSNGGDVNAVQFNGFRLNTGTFEIGTNCTLALNSNAILNLTGNLFANGSAASPSTIDVNTASLTSGGQIFIGANSALNVNAGGFVSATQAISVAAGGTMTHDSNLFLNIGNNGSINISGQWVLFKDYSLPGTRKLFVNAGGSIYSTGFLDVVGGGSGTGTMLVDGAGANVQVGIGGAASQTSWSNFAGSIADVTFSNGGQGAYSSGLDIGQNGGTARVNLQSGSGLSVANTLRVGGLGVATMTIGNARLTANGPAVFGNNANVTLQGGSINFNGDATFSTGSKLTWTSGSVNIAGGKTFNVAGGTITGPGSTALGNGATIKLTNNAGTGGKFDNTSYFDIANGAATGTLLVDGVGSRFTAGGTTDWGAIGGNAATVTFSNSGAGTFATLRMSTSGGASSINLQSSGQLNVTSSLIAGSADALVSVNIAGGTLNCMGNASILDGTLINITGGGLLLNGNSTVGTRATIKHSGGTLGIAANTTLNVAGGTINNTASSRALASGVTVRVTNGGQFLNSDYFDVANGAASGTLLVDGVGSRFTSASTFSDWGKLAGNFATITFSDRGAGTYSAGVEIASTGGKALVNVNSLAVLSVARLLTGGTGSTATINIAGGTLASSGSATFRAGTLVNFSAGGLNTGGLLTTTGDARVLLTTGGNKVPHVGGLSMSGTSTIDLNDNDMIVGSLTPKSAIEGFVRTGRNSGSWIGSPGITSTAAKNRVPKNTTLGVLSGAEFTSVGGNGTFSGQSYSATDTLVKYTYYGDTDFNGVIDFDDYSRVDAGFNNNRIGWFNGDVDYNGIVDFDDYSLIDQAFNTQSGSLRQAMAYLDGGGKNDSDMNAPELRMVVEHFNQFGQSYATAFLADVPEPTTAGFAATFGGLSLLRRRRRH